MTMPLPLALVSVPRWAMCASLNLSCLMLKIDVASVMLCRSWSAFT